MSFFSVNKSSQYFQIESAGYQKCLTVVRQVRYNWRLGTKRVVVGLQLRSCIPQSKGQSWSWTSSGRLKSALNQQCLSVVSVWRGYRGRTYGVAMQPCNSISVDQEWICHGRYLKLKNKNLYLVPVLYSGRRGGNVVVSSKVSNSCVFRRYGSSKSLCGEDGT